jgi:hypothetical protein
MEIQSIKNGEFSERINNVSNGYKVGAAIGLILGLAGGIYFQKNKLICSLLGLAIGGYMGKEIGQAKNPILNINLKNK